MQPSVASTDNRNRHLFRRRKRPGHEGQHCQIQQDYALQTEQYHVRNSQRQIFLPNGVVEGSSIQRRRSLPILANHPFHSEATLVVHHHDDHYQNRDWRHSGRNAQYFRSYDNEFSCDDSYYNWYPPHPNEMFGTNFNREHDFRGFIPSVNRFCRWLLVHLSLLVASFITFTILYYGAMPYRHVIRPIYFDYNNNLAHFDGDRNEPSRNEISKNHRTNNNVVATAVLDLTKKSDVSWESLDFDTKLKPSKNVLAPEKSYYIEILLELPETEKNKQVGMFGIQTDLYSLHTNHYQNETGNETYFLDETITNNQLKEDRVTRPSTSSLPSDKTLKLIATSKRSTRFPHKSKWVEIVQTNLLLIPIMLRIVDETKTVIVPSFRHFIENKKSPLNQVHIMIRNVNEGSGVNALQPYTNNPEITKAFITIGNERTTFQEVLYDWYITCFTFGTLILFIFYKLLYTILMKSSTSSNGATIDLSPHDIDDPSLNLSLDENDLDSILQFTHHDTEDDADDFFSISSQDNVTIVTAENGSGINPSERLGETQNTMNYDGDGDDWEDI